MNNDFQYIGSDRSQQLGINDSHFIGVGGSQYIGNIVPNSNVVNSFVNIGCTAVFSKLDIAGIEPSTSCLLSAPFLPPLNTSFYFWEN